MTGNDFTITFILVAAFCWGLAMFGADPASELAAHIETLASRGDLVSVVPLLPVLVAEVNQLLVVLGHNLSG